MTWCWHRWSKWEQYEQKYGYRPPVRGVDDVVKLGGIAGWEIMKSRIRERRHCLKCGTLRDRIVIELHAL